MKGIKKIISMIETLIDCNMALSFYSERYEKRYTLYFERLTEGNYTIRQKGNLFTPDYINVILRERFNDYKTLQELIEAYLPDMFEDR